LTAMFQYPVHNNPSLTAMFQYPVHNSPSLTAMFQYPVHNSPSLTAMFQYPVGLRQPVQHSDHADIPFQNSKSHRKCTPVCNKPYAPHSLQHPLRKHVIYERPNKHHIKVKAHPNPLSHPLMQTLNNRRLKRCWPFD